jgi:hypothetical protein
MIAGLGAPGPHASLGPEARVFDRFVGTWDCDYSFIAEDGKVTHQPGELLFGWIIDGRAIQDVWIVQPRAPGEERFVGTSVRFYEPSSGKWKVVFVAPTVGAIRQVEGGAEGDRIVLIGRRPDGADGEVSRWSFDDIKPDSFTWRGEKSVDGGKTWRLREEHRMTRRH